MDIRCSGCGSAFPKRAIPHRCVDCGGLYELGDTRPGVHVNGEPGIWCFPSLQKLHVEPVSLGEGGTPLLEATAFGRTVYMKCEFANPTGSFKDRGMTALVSVMKDRGVRRAVEDSSGNAGASFAAYAARAGIEAEVYVPVTASGSKIRQIAVHGAKIITVGGGRRKAAEAAEEAARGGRAYASHAASPFCLAGYRTCARELAEQLKGSPGSVIIPLGQGGLLLGLAGGFGELLQEGAIRTVPRLVGVQSAACAPFCQPAGSPTANPRPTVAEGVAVDQPLRAAAVRGAVAASGGRFVSVEEDAIIPGRDGLAHLGFYVEPTSALVWDALRQVADDLADPIVLVLTGAGYKSPL